jgi:uncharacterized protein YdeI (YjbR/CyaY-like superfamily)
MMKPLFFAKPETFRKWLESNHQFEQELLVGFYKKSSKRPSITWPESVREALCFGWIDGVRRAIDSDSYCIRFTPRRPNSVWSAINTNLIEELTTAGLMRPAGLRAFAYRNQEKSAIYAYEQRKTAKLDAALERQFRASAAAWTFFQAQSPWYRRTAIYWVTSAKKEETRLRRLATLIRSSAEARRIDSLNPGSRKGSGR